MSKLVLPLVTIMVIFLLDIVFFKTEKIKTYETIVYSKLLILDTFYSIFAVIEFLVATNLKDANLVQVLQKTYMVVMISMNAYICIYYSLLSKFNKKVSFIIDKLVKTIAFISSVLILILPLNINCNNEVLKITGPSYKVALISTVIYVLVCILFSLYILLTKNAKAKKNIPIISLLIFYILGFILKDIFQDILFETFFYTFTFLIMYFTIENQDIKTANKLKLAEKQVENANRAKSEFLSSMSHEFRTPLNAIVGLSNDIIENDNQSKDVIIEDAKDIREASNTLLEIIGNILDLNKIDINKMEIINQKYNFKKEIENLCKINTVRIGNKNIEFKVNISSDIPEYLYGDITHIKEIINNLISNAIKYTSKGRVLLNVDCNIENGICNLNIGVQDTGTGIEKSKYNELFNNKNNDNKSVGLTITTQLINMLNGSIKVETNPGFGTLFLVKIPQKIFLQKPIKNEISNINKSNKTIKKVLLVDDNNLNLKVAHKTLLNYNFEIIDAHNGKEAIETYFKHNDFDLILMDIMMPVMNGEEALKELKKKNDFKTPVIALTADAVDGAKNKYLSEGFSYYVSKPFTKDDIDKALKNIANI